MTGHDPYEGLTPLPSFTLTSTDLDDGGALRAAQYSSDSGGEDVSPQLSWSGFPAETKTFAVTVYDPDAPTAAGFWHWAVANIPAAITELPAGAGAPDATLPEGALTLPNEMRLRQYIGAAPPEGTGVHRYFIVVHALPDALEIDPDSTPSVLGFQMNFSAIARAVLVGTGQAGGATA